jgi:hypothetical protein
VVKKNLLFAAIAAILFSSPVFADEGQKKDIGVTFQLDYLSQWLSKGAPAYGSHGAVFTIVDIDFWGSGFGAQVIHRNSTSSGYVDKQRIDYRPYFKSILFKDLPYQTNYLISTEYEHYYGLDRHRAYTTWEWICSFSWPKLLPDGFTPTYIVHYEYPAVENKIYHYSSIEGWVHRFILGYDIKVPELQNPINLSSEVAYTDGLGRADHDWSYAVFGLSTLLKIDENLSFSPGIYEQITMDKSVCPRKDVTYCILSMKYKF